MVDNNILPLSSPLYSCKHVYKGSVDDADDQFHCYKNKSFIQRKKKMSNCKAEEENYQLLTYV